MKQSLQTFVFNDLVFQEEIQGRLVNLPKMGAKMRFGQSLQLQKILAGISAKGMLLGSLGVLISFTTSTAFGQNAVYPGQASYGQFQQAGYQNYYPAEGAYFPPQYQDNSQVSYEYIDRQPLVGKYSRPGYVNGETPYDAAFKTVLKNTWIRLEYLNWSISKPGNSLLGSDSIDLLTGLPIEDPSKTGTTTADLGAGLILIDTSVPDTGRFDFPNNNGFRGSVGVNTTFGEIEASGFVLNQAIETVDYTDFINTVAVIPRLIRQTHLVGGNISDFAYYYDTSFYATMTSQIFGGDANIHFDVRKIDLGLNHDASLGFRFIQLRERLYSDGATTNLGNIPLTHLTYDSHTINNLYGPQVGFRSVFKHQFFELGVENQFMVGINNLEAGLQEKLSDTTILSNDIYKQTTQRIAGAYNLSVFGNVKLSEKFLIRVGYDFLWMSRISRPDDNIVYNTFTVNDPESTLRIIRSDMFVQGLTLGGEYRF